MRLAIISDVHANEEALRAALTAISRSDVDRIVCLGDVVGYNANPAECIELLRSAGAVCVAGNHDRAVLGLTATEDFNLSALRAVRWTRAVLDQRSKNFLARLPLKATVCGEVVAVHGALHPESGCEWVRLESDELLRRSFAALAAQPAGIRVCAYGHTHRLAIHEMVGDDMRQLTGTDVRLRHDAFYLVNPGSVGATAEGQTEATYLVYDTDRRRIWARSIAYDASISRLKARRAGLVPFSAFLPRSARTVLRTGLRALGLHAALKAAVRRERSGPSKKRDRD